MDLLEENNGSCGGNTYFCVMDVFSALIRKSCVHSCLHSCHGHAEILHIWNDFGMIANGELKNISKKNFKYHKEPVAFWHSGGN